MQLLWCALLVVFSATNGVQSSENQDVSFTFEYEADDGSYRKEIRYADGRYRVEHGKIPNEFERHRVVEYLTRNLPENDVEVKRNATFHS